MRQRNLLSAALIMQLATIACVAGPAHAQAHYQLNGQAHYERVGFFHRHPYAAAAAAGALTGGVGGILLGGTLLGGAATGAGTHVGFHYLHQKYEAYKARRSRWY